MPLGREWKIQYQAYEDQQAVRLHTVTDPMQHTTTYPTYLWEGYWRTPHTRYVGNPGGASGTVPPATIVPPGVPPALLPSPVPPYGAGPGTPGGDDGTGGP